MILYECDECGEPYYKKVGQCPYCDCKTFSESEEEGNERDIILTVLKEIDLESGEYQQFDEDTLEEKVEKKLKQKFDWVNFSFALDAAEKKGYFTKVIIYVSSA